MQNNNNFIYVTNLMIILIEATAPWDVNMIRGKKSSNTHKLIFRLKFCGFETAGENRLRLCIVAKYLLLICISGTVP